MSSGELSAGTSFATGFPCWVIRTGSPVFLTRSIIAEHWTLNFPAAISFTVCLEAIRNYLLKSTSNHFFCFSHLHNCKTAWRRPKMRLRRENLLWNVMLGTGVY